MGPASSSAAPLDRNRLIRADTDHPPAKALTRMLEVTFGPRAVNRRGVRHPGREAGGHFRRVGRPVRGRIRSAAA